MILPPEEPVDKTRQKSCNACVRSKRRCDKRTPRCARCADKGVHCVYPNLPAEQPFLARRAQQQPSVMDVAEVDVDASPGSGGLGTGGFFSSGTHTTTTNSTTNSNAVSSSDHETTPSSCSSESASFVDVTAGMDFDPVDIDNMVLDPLMSLDGMQPGAAFGEFGDFMNYMSVDGGMQHQGHQQQHQQQHQHQRQGSEMRLWRTDVAPQAAHTLPEKPAAPQPPTPPVLDHRLNEDAYREMVSSACANFTPWEIHDPDSRVGFLVKSMTDFPLTFARTRATPFLHRNLYRGRDAPRAIMTLYTATTAYAARNDSNRDWAIRLLYESVDELHRDAAAAQARELETEQQHSTQALALAQMVGGLPVGTETLVNKLARAQALFMYQIIRAMDGDISLRAQAERDMPTLRAWLEELEGYRDNLADYILMDDEAVRARPPKSWETWLIHECLRRTIFIAHGFMAIYEMLKWVGRSRDADPAAACGPDPGRFACGHRWTASRSLWEADCHRAFNVAWREKPRWFVENIFVADVAKNAAPSDVDDFTRLFLTTFMGIQAMTDFMEGEDVPIPPSFCNPGGIC